MNNKNLIEKETVIQFGEGNFLRGFVDYFLQVLNDKGLADNKVVVVQPIEQGLADLLEAQDCNYNLFLRGIEDGKIIDEHIYVDIISRSINPYNDFADYINLAKNENFRFIVSNTTESGIEFKETDKFDDKPQKTFPGKLTRLLYERYRLGLKGFIILSCELIDDNGKELLKCCKQYADLWNLEDDFITWLENENYFASTLVDRIVTGFPAEEYKTLCERIGYEDKLMDTAEVFHLWVIEGNHEAELPLQKAGFNVIWTDDIKPYKKRKVRILNGAHTCMVLGARLYGLDTVLDCMNDEKVNQVLQKAIFEEIIPILGENDENISFGKAVIDRFSNPFIKHKLLSIALNSVSKFKVRVLPTILEYREKFNKNPKVLVSSLAELIAFYKTDEANDAPEIIEFMRSADILDILQREDYWGLNLDFLYDDVKYYYDIIKNNGMDSVYSELI